MAGMATHPTAELNTIVLRYDVEACEELLNDAPEAYYVTDYPALSAGIDTTRSNPASGSNRDDYDIVAADLGEGR